MLAGKEFSDSDVGGVKVGDIVFMPGVKAVNDSSPPELGLVVSEASRRPRMYLTESRRVNVFWFSEQCVDPEPAHWLEALVETR